MIRPLPFLFVMILPFLALAQTPPAPSVTLSWQPVTTMSDGSPVLSSRVSYNIYGGHTATGPWTLAANVSTSGSVRSGVTPGLDCYYITAVVNSVQSLPVTPICVTVTATVSTVPNIPTGFTAKQTQ